MGRKDPALGWTHGRCSSGKQKRKMCYCTFRHLKVKRDYCHCPTNEELLKEHRLGKALQPHQFTFSVLTCTILKLAGRSRQQLIKSATEFKIKKYPSCTQQMFSLPSPLATACMRISLDFSKVKVGVNKM